MSHEQGAGSGGAASVVGFDDDAIREELRKMVEKQKDGVLEKLTFVCAEVSQETGWDGGQAMNAKLEAIKAEATQRFQRMLDFIDRR